MSINKFITNLDLARQAEIMSGETAVFQGGIELGIPFSGFPSGVDTSTIVSLGIVNSEFAAFSGNTGTTIFNVTDPSSPYYSVSATTLSASPYTIIDGGSITETVSATTYPTIMTFTALSGDCCSTPISVSFTPPIIQELYDRGLYDGLFNGLGQASIGTTYIDESFYNVGSVFSGANLNMEIVEYGVHGTTPAWVTGTTSGTVIEYSALTQYWVDPIYENLTSGLTLPITPESADTQTSDYVWTLTDSTIIDENFVGLQYTGYSVTYSFDNVIIDPESPSITGGVTGATSADTYYLGTVTATLENFSAGTLDYKGTTNWLIVNGSATIDERLTTDRMTIHTLGTGSPVTMLAVDVNGNVVGGTGGTTDDTGAFTSTTANNTIIPTNAAGNTNDSDYASILGGQNNTISGTSTSSSIVGGENNVVKNVSDYSIIAGGEGNSMDDSDYSAIIAGNNNHMTGATNVDKFVMVGGFNNTSILNRWGGMFGGINNGMTGATNASAIVGGGGNKITNIGSASSASSIVGGDNNLINSDNSFIGGGNGNTIEDVGTENSSFIGAGGNNTISASTSAFIGAGGNNTISAADVSSIMGGDSNIIDNSKYSGIFAGSGNTISADGVSGYEPYGSAIIGGKGNIISSTTGSTSLFTAGAWSVIAGGSNNTISGHSNSFIGGGSNNTIDFSLGNNFIIGGSSNTNKSAEAGIIGANNSTISAGSDSSVVIGGSSNMIDATDATIVGGSSNKTKGSDTSIIGGTGNVITGATPVKSVIIGGENSDISASTRSVIIGGTGNGISGSTRSSIIGGLNNTMNGRSNSVIIGGSSIDATNDNTAYVPNLNIGTLGGGASVNNLGIDASGNVVVGSAGSGGVTIDPYNDLGNVSTTQTWDVSGTSTNYELTLTGSITLNLNNVRNGDYGTLIVEQDGVGSHTLAFGTVNGGAGTHKVVNGGGGSPTLTSTPNAIDLLSFTYNGTTMYWSVGNDYT